MLYEKTSKINVVTYFRWLLCIVICLLFNIACSSGAPATQIDAASKIRDMDSTVDEARSRSSSNTGREINASDDSSKNERFANKLFDGEWAYTKKCGFGRFVNILFRSAGSDVSGEWSIGTSLRGSDGLLKGAMRGGKLFTRYCSQDGEKGYRTCPEYGDETDYFILQGDDLIRYQKFGNEYKKEIVLHRNIAGKQLPVGSADCENANESAS